MKIILSLNKEKPIFNNKKYFLHLKTTNVNKEYDNSFYGDIGKFLYAAKHHLIDDETCGFITNKTYFKMISNDMENIDYDHFKLSEKILMIISPLKNLPYIDLEKMTIKEELLIFICSSIIKDKEVSAKDSEFIMSLLNELENSLNSLLTGEYNIAFNSVCPYVDSNIFLTSNEEFYKYAEWLESILNPIQKLKSVKKLKNNRNFSIENKQIGNFLSKRLLSIYLFNKKGIVPQSLN